MSKSAHHRELAGRARWLPRGIASKRTLPILYAAQRFMGLKSSSGVEVKEACSWVFRPNDSVVPRPALLWFHGGGLVVGDARQDESFCLRVMRELDVTVASVQYRLAPKDPYPAALDDGWRAFQWLCEQPEVDATRVAVGGASAGGCLAAALSLLARERGGPQPCFQLLVYPMLDDRSSLRTDLDDDSFRMWNRASNAFAWNAYLRNLDDDEPPATAVPARAHELAGLPPAWIGVGTLDLFHDEDLEYAARLNRAKVRCDLEVVPGAYHGFDAAHASAEVSRAFRDAQLSALRAALR